jgi:predicted ATP-dependent endonuclease of OLD family
MIKIQAVRINNFKSFKSDSISGFCGFNMLYGYNNSGKSNILKFIETIFKRKKAVNKTVTYTRDGKLVSEDVNSLGNFFTGVIEKCPYIFRDNNRSEPIIFEVLLKVDKDELSILNEEILQELAKYYFNNHDYCMVQLTGEINTLGFDSAQIEITKALLNNKEIYSFQGVNDNYFEPATDVNSVLKANGFAVYNSILNIFNDLVLLLDNDRHLNNESELEEKVDSMTKPTSKNFKNWMYSMYLDSEKYTEFLGLIKFINDFKVNVGNNSELKDSEINSPLNNLSIGFSVKEKTLEIMMENTLKKRLPLSSYGTGIQQILYILASIYTSNPKIVLIEELELNLSPTYQGELLKNLKKLQDVKKIDQVIFSTHSQYFKFRNDFSIYEVSINNEGESKTNKVDSVSKRFFNRKNLG